LKTDPSTHSHTFILTVEEGGKRLDRYVATALPDLSRTAVQRLIEEEKITVNNTPTRSAHKLHKGDTIVVHIPPPKPTDIKPQALPLRILYEDEDILVVNKAPGMVVHPGAGHPDGTLVNAVLAHCPDLHGVGGERRPGVVHRLDKDTSGVIILAKHDQAIRQLQQQFKRRTVQKTYIALVVGKLDPEEGIIDAPIGRHPRHRKRMAVVPQGRAAYTRWEVIKYLRDIGQTAAKRSSVRSEDSTTAPQSSVGNRFNDAPQNAPLYTLLQVRPATGRTHQIRVHLSWLGYPVVGDRKYGPSRPHLAAPRQFLHAYQLTLSHPKTEETMTFTAPLSSDLETVMERLHPAVKPSDISRAVVNGHDICNKPVSND
jgi:23S rRNA pseudouridine1911/1915/1917 synthase